MASRTFPRKTLEQALRVPQAIKDKNGGNPWATEQIAAALGMGAKGTNFFYLAAASRDYGLTEGSRETAEISLSELGRRAVYPQSDTELHRALLDAFLNIEVFRRVLEHFGGNNLPERKFLENTLHQTFGVDPKYHDEFVDLFEKNCRFLSIGKEFSRGGPVPLPLATSIEDGSSVTVATPEDDEDAPLCFVIMPFTERDERHETGFFAETLQHVLTPAATAAGFRVATAQRTGTDIIQSTIVNDLLAADLVLADLTEHNPNVLFELGMRMHGTSPWRLCGRREPGRFSMSTTCCGSRSTTRICGRARSRLMSPVCAITSKRPGITARPGQPSCGYSSLDWISVILIGNTRLRSLERHLYYVEA